MKFSAKTLAFSESISSYCIVGKLPPIRRDIISIDFFKARIDDVPRPSTGWSLRAQLFTCVKLITVNLVRSIDPKKIAIFIYLLVDTKTTKCDLVCGRCMAPHISQTYGLQCARLATLASWFWFAVSFLLHLFDSNTMKEGTHKESSASHYEIDEIYEQKSIVYNLILSWHRVDSSVLVCHWTTKM